LDPDLASRLASDNPARDRWLPYPLAWPLIILELWCRAMIDITKPVATEADRHGGKESPECRSTVSSW
jgi:hypothetical protein